MDGILTSEESVELNEHPVGTVTYMNDRQFDIRLSIAKKICKFFLENDPSLDDKANTIYQKFSMWKFYCNPNMSLPRRMYGIKDIENEILSMVTSYIALTYDSSGISCSDIVSVDRWTEDQIKIIKLTKCPAIFLDPLGFLIVLQKNAK